MGLAPPFPHAAMDASGTCAFKADEMRTLVPNSTYVILSDAVLNALLAEADHAESVTLPRKRFAALLPPGHGHCRGQSRSYSHAVPPDQGNHDQSPQCDHCRASHRYAAKALSPGNELSRPDRSNRLPRLRHRATMRRPNRASHVPSDRKSKDDAGSGCTGQADSGAIA
jgi:hypothetical protein